MTENGKLDTTRVRLFLGLALPLFIAGMIFLADGIEGPRQAFAGVATSVAFMAAIFGRPGSTAIVAALIVVGAHLHGLFSEEAGTTSQLVRTVLIAITAFSAVAYSSARVRREEERAKLYESKRELELTSKLAMRDQLTGILNRRGVIEALESEERWPKSVAIFDLDKLKQVNDTHGHEAGDTYVKLVAQRISSAVSAGDILGRWGGDEFILVLALDKEQAHKVTERVVGQVSSQPITAGNVVLEPRISAGVAQWNPSKTLEQALAKADSALYAAKAAGGNRARLGG